VYDYIEDNRNKKATGGRVNFANGTEESYNPEIPSLGFSDPIDILEQQMINEKDPTKILALDYQLTQAINLRIFYDWIRTTPQTSNSFPTANTNAGFSLRFNLQ
jgi:cell surface protein SprA